MHHCLIEEMLKAGGLRRTRKRHRLMALFLQKRAWSTAELRRRLGDVDLSTVYRNVHELLRRKVIVRVPLHGRETRFELARTPHHAHLVCDRCSRTECIPCPVRTRTEHSLELRGRCSACN